MMIKVTRLNDDAFTFFNLNQKKNLDRIFDEDFIIFDLIFCGIWIVLLFVSQQIIPFLFGLFGFIVNFIVDYCIWYKIFKTRSVVIPNPSVSKIVVFFLYFGFTYGMIEFSFAITMILNSFIDSWWWIILLNVGWILSGFLSRKLKIADEKIIVSRKMGNGRYYFTIAEYGILLSFCFVNLFDLDFIKVVYLFFVGFITHFSFEMGLYVNKTRTTDLKTILLNSIFEFNVGIPILYFLTIIF